MEISYAYSYVVANKEGAWVGLQETGFGAVAAAAAVALVAGGERAAFHLGLGPSPVPRARAQEVASQQQVERKLAEPVVGQGQVFP